MPKTGFKAAPETRTKKIFRSEVAVETTTGFENEKVLKKISQCSRKLPVGGAGGSNEMAKREAARPGHAKHAAAPDVTGCRQTCHIRL